MILTAAEICKAVGARAASERWLKDAQAIESALLEKLRAGVELPEPAIMTHLGTDAFTRDQLHQYGDALALAAREQAIEEWRVHLLELWEKGDFDLKDALAASPQEQQP